MFAANAAACLTGKSFNKINKILLEHQALRALMAVFIRLLCREALLA